MCINGDVKDISKRHISKNLLTPHTPYDGPVIVKTNCNFGGEAERKLAKKKLLPHIISKVKCLLPWSWSGYLKTHQYPIYDHLKDVPRVVWHNKNLIVEKFLPEREGDYYCMRQWVFLGDREFSFRLYSNHTIIKSRNAHHVERNFPIPEELRVMRKTLRFDYGKFDYTIVDGEVVLIDANRTPSVGRVLTPAKQQIINELKEGLWSLLESP